MPERPEALVTQTTDDILSDLRSVFADLEVGFNTKDPRLADEHFTADTTVIVPDGTVVRGWDALFAYHTERLGGPANDWRTSYSIMSSTVVDNDVVLVHTRQDTTTADGEFVNHGTFVFTRRDGRWWIAAVHNTNVLA